MAAILKDVIERLKAEGQLIRNTGTNSIKTVIEKLSTITPIFSSIENSVKEQTSIMTQTFNLNQELRETQKRTEDLSSISEMRNSAAAEEAREAKRAAAAAAAGKQPGILAGSFLGVGLANAMSAIMSPLKNIFKLVARNGPLAIVIGLLYSVFRDIGENENFRNTIESIKNAWNDSILPIFERLKDTVNSLVGTGDFSETLTLFKEKWDNFRQTFQDFVLLTVEDIFQAIGGIFDGIGLLLDGEWKKGISKIIGSVLTGIKNIANNAITAWLRLFGVDFGEDGSFLGWLDNKWSKLLVDIYNIWENFTTSIGEQWKRAKIFLKETFKNFTKPIRDAVSSAFSVITDLFSFGEEDKTAMGLLGKLTDIVFAPVNMAINFVRGMFGFSSDDQEPFKLNEFITEKMNHAMNWIRESMTGFGETLNKKFQQLADYVSSVPDRVMLFAESMFVDVSEKLQIGFLILGNWIASIPARIKLMALNAIRSATSGLPEWAQIVSQSDIAEAGQAVSGRESELEESTSAVRASAAESRAGIERRMAELNRVDQAAVSSSTSVVMVNNSPVIAPNVTNVQGGSSVSNMNMFGSGGGGFSSDPYGFTRAIN